MQTRTGPHWSDRHPSVVAALAEVRSKSAYLDGELCGIGGDVLLSFSRTQAATGDAARLLLFDLLHLDGRQPAPTRAQSISKGSVRHIEEVGDRLVETLGSEMRPGLHIGRLNADAHPIATALDAASERVSHIEIKPGLPHVERLPLVSEGGVVGDDQSALDARQIGGQTFGDPIDGIVLLLPPILAKRKTTRERRGGPLCSRGADGVAAFCAGVTA